jgi:integrase
MVRYTQLESIMSEDANNHLDKMAMVEANQIPTERYNLFLDKVELIPTNHSPINGKVARLAFEFMEDTGLRITETLHVEKKDIDYDTRILTVTHPKSERQCKCSTWKYKDLMSRQRVLDKVDKNCKICHGKGRWKKPQRTTITPRIVDKLEKYTDELKPDEQLFTASRVSFWKWSKKAGVRAGIHIFHQKEEQMIKGMYLHLFRAFCSKRTLKDAHSDDFKDQIVAAKLRHTFATVTDRYTKIDINYLINWENQTYSK